METFTDIFKALLDVWKEMFEGIIKSIPKMLKFLLWIFCGILILPCVFISATFYTPWTKWGEKF